MHQELTGYRRYRVGQSVGCYGSLILQVEYSFFMDGKWHLAWRDATANDVSETVIGLPDKRG
jgi:hypothetical protein